jgi:hypothetical protein
MTDLVYSTEVIDHNDLMFLKDFALIFLRNWAYCAKFQDLLLCITLCQGAANHYAVCNGYAKRYFDSTRIGVKDFDIWFFFGKEQGRIFNPRWIGKKDLGYTKFGRNPDDVGFTGRRIDFIGRSITFGKMDIEGSIKRWLQSGGGASPKYLSQKAVVGLYPDEVLGKVIWVNPDLT